ncbi:TPA: hypothetical protein ACOEHM_004399 [Enterobacter hormaechei subsp. xiangfangensis]|uniref:hypothetical protein n=1 Tax=Enterobacter hormaechei TaxID=158836 RepID=UPI003B5E2261
MSVKRYEWVACDEHSCHCDVVESAEGDMVDYEDYAALEARCAALAAENAGLKQFCKDAAFDADYEAELGIERGGFTDGLSLVKTPHTNAFLAEVRAQGVDMFALMFAEEAIKTNNITTGWRAKASRAASEYAEALREDAAQLRKGVQS